VEATAPIAHYINGITDLAAKLKGIGIALTDEEITDVLIFNLDNDYSKILQHRLWPTPCSVGKVEKKRRNASIMHHIPSKGSNSV